MTSIGFVVIPLLKPHRDFMKYLKILFGFIICFVAVFCLSKNSSAVSDVTFVLSTSTTNQNFTFCDSVSSCSGYKYLIVTPNFTVNASDSNVPLRFRFNGSSSNGSVTIPYSTNQTIIKLDEGISSVNYFMQTSTNAFITGDRTITMVLSESLPDIPPCPDCPDCPIDCEESFIVQLFKSGFWGIATAIVSIIVPIIALFLVFRLVHDFFWGRG